MAARAVSGRRWKGLRRGRSPTARRNLEGLRLLVERLNRRLNGKPPPTVDLSAVSADPIAAIYLSDGAVPVIEIPLSHLRLGWLGFPLDGSDTNPFVRTAAEYINGEVSDYRHSVLCAHYRTWQPRTMGEALGLCVSDESRLAQPAEAVVLPWSRMAGVVDPDERIEFFRRHIGEEFRARHPDIDRSVSPTYGQAHFGPVTAGLGGLEFERYRNAAEYIAEFGFIPSLGGYIGVEILADRSRWVAQVQSGLHRVAIVSALGIDPVPVAISVRPMLVRREDCLSWPGVRSGLFTPDEATMVFDRIMDGRAPSN